MRRGTFYVCMCATVCAGAMALGYATFGWPPPNAGNGGNGRLSPASLNLDTCGCPTTFGQPTCEQQTSWSLDKVSNTDDLDNPSGESFSFTVTVTEGPTGQTLIATGQIVITNSGDQTPSLASVVVLLESFAPGAGNAPGPSGNNWFIEAITADSEAAACGASAFVCDGGNSSKVLVDPLPNPNACSVHDNDGDGLLDGDPPDDIDNDEDGLIDEDGPDDGVVPSADDLRIDLLVTFTAGGRRGGTCSADVNCNGEVDADEFKQVRTVQQRLRFDPVQCVPTCECPTLTDLGVFSLDESCAVVDSTTTLDEQVCATGVEGTETVREITGTVTCDCDPAVHGGDGGGFCSRTKAAGALTTATATTPPACATCSSPACSRAASLLVTPTARTTVTGPTPSC